MFAVVFSFTAPCWSGSAVFSTEFLDKAQFFPWPRGRADLRDVTVVYSLPSCDVDSDQVLTFQHHFWFSCVLTIRRTTLLLGPGGAAAKTLPKIRPSLSAPPAHRVQAMGQTLIVTLERSQPHRDKTQPQNRPIPIRIVGLCHGFAFFFFFL